MDFEPSRDTRRRSDGRVATQGHGTHLGLVDGDLLEHDFRVGGLLLEDGRELLELAP